MPDLPDLSNKAIEIAKTAHVGQVDKAGKPYINHPLHVMNSVDTLEEKIVAVLHDTIEPKPSDRDIVRVKKYQQNILKLQRARELLLSQL
jgi:(p)ppGpp synthase/HD superfamily hydrolase